MRPSVRGAVAGAAALLVAACADGGLRTPTEVSAPRLDVAAAAVAAPRFTEIHYDNISTDVNERIEVTAPADVDITGWTVALYNGSASQRSVYTTTPLSDALVTACGADRVYVLSYPSNGIQNGDPDGMALVDAGGNAVEFLSYDGSFVAASGPAAGMQSVDIGVGESNSSTPADYSLQRNAFGGWDAPAANSFGVCPDGTVPPPSPTTITISELMGAPLGALSASWGEWFEVHNYGAEDVNLGGWSIRSAGDTPHTISASVVVPAGGYVVLGRSDDPTKNGGVDVAYNYYSGGSTIWLDASDWLVLRSPAAATVDSVMWTSLPIGATRAVRDQSADNADVDGANWGFSTTRFAGGDYGTPNAPNTGLSDGAPAVPTGVVRITFSGRDGSDPALPVGFEDQLFASAYDAAGQRVETTITWSSVTPALASVDQDGVVHALGAGTALVRATAADGRSATYAMPTTVAIASTTAVYEGNTEFGVPTDGTPGDDFIVTRPEYTASYSQVRNTPNWVSYDLEATHFGPLDRCDCFTADPTLPPSFAHITTASYTGAGAFAGYGIDRGHLARSADRTSGSLDNATTFYFSNIIPQAADLNQGPWAVLENYLGDLARDGTHEVYVITGVAGNAGTLKGEGVVVIPERVWKVALILPRDAGLESVHSAADVQLVAVDFPNVAGLRNADWHDYRTTVNAIESESGYDLLSLLPDDIEWLLEAGLVSPDGVAAADLLDILTSGIQGLETAGTLTHGNANSLLAKLGTVQKKLDKGNISGPLGAFVNEVEAMVRSGRMSVAEGASLIRLAGWVGSSAAN